MNRSVFQFSIATMLFACLCVAGFLAGKRAGFQEGYASGRAKRDAEDPYPAIYEVGDLIRAAEENGDVERTQLNYDSLMLTIESTLVPDEWEALGGQCTMAPVPHLESLVVNATSGVHEKLTNFLGDLSSVKLAIAAAEDDLEQSRLHRERWVQGLLDSVSEKLEMELTPIGNDFDIVGAWSAQKRTGDGVASLGRYDFDDNGNVEIPVEGDSDESLSGWYTAHSGSVVLSGYAYVAATTSDETLVLIPIRGPQSFIVATRAEGEP